MTDRELLEAAAKAAGIKIVYGPFQTAPILPYNGEADGDLVTFWNPLEDDGDALRLLVAIGKLNGALLGVGPDGAGVEGGPYRDYKAEEGRRIGEPFDKFDIAAAVRRAIVRVAATLADSDTSTR
jgi:hypothetical protein